MSAESRITRSQIDLERELFEQIQLLKHDCQRFDDGFEPAAKRVALSLRVLLHNHRRSRALLLQLGLRSCPFLDTAGPLKPENPVPEFKLVAVEMSSRLAKYLPLVAVGGDPNRERMIPFDAWWTEPVLKDSKGVKFSRSNLVSHVADTDGGAHVDSELEESYMALSRQNSIGGTFGRGEESVPIQGRLELACIRQIAHEVLATIRQGASRFAEAAAPVIPASVGAPGEKRLIVQYLEIGPDLSK